MKIIIDAMGGDNAPEEIVKGAVRAQKELNVDIVLVGQQEKVEACLKNEGCDSIPVVDAGEVITMEDDPVSAVRTKKDSSMSVALRMLRDGEGDAMVSAGSTGALLTGATLTVKRIQGIRRAALSPIIPAGKYGAMIIDCGANVECTPEYLLQFAYMGSFYMKKIRGCENPRVALLNNGTEEIKGGDLQRNAYALLKKAGDEGRINFVGNVEGTGVYSGNCEVVVTDGFTGNILLKTTEGVIKFMVGKFKDVFFKSLKNKLAAAVLKKDMKEMKKTLDVNEVGGTALMGISRPVIKAHGASNAACIFSAVRQARDFAESGIIEDITENIEYMKIRTE